MKFRAKYDEIGPDGSCERRHETVEAKDPAEVRIAVMRKLKAKGTTAIFKTVKKEK